MWWRRLLEEGGWGKIWVGLGMATALAGGGLIYQQVQDGGSDSACPLPEYPDANCTGVPAGTSLTAYTGPDTVIVDDTVIDSKTIGCLAVSAEGVIIRNSVISCGTDPWAVLVVDSDLYGTADPLLIEDSEIDCQGTNATGVAEAHFILRRVEITQCENGADMNQNILIEDSYIHNLASVGGDPHEDGVQMGGGHWTGSTYECNPGCGLNVTLRHNTIFGMGNGGGTEPDDSTFGTSAIIMHAVDENILVQDNLLAGGAFAIYCNRTGSGINVDVIDNHFTTRFGENVGSFGVSYDNECGDEDDVSGNVIDETDELVDPF